MITDEDLITQLSVSNLKVHYFICSGQPIFSLQESISYRIYTKTISGKSECELALTFLAAPDCFIAFLAITSSNNVFLHA